MTKKKNIKEDSKKTKRKTKKNATNNKESEKDAKKNKDKKVPKKQNNEKLGYIVLGIIIVAVIIYGIFLLSPRASEEFNPVYNGFVFQEDGDYWRVGLKTVVGDQTIPFYYHPSELEEIPYAKKINSDLLAVQKNKGKFSIAISPDLKESGTAVISAVEISKISGNVFGLETAAGYSGPVDELPVFNCENATPKNFVVELELGDANSISAKSYCAVLTAQNETDLIKLSDLLVFKLMGIMENN